MSSTKSHARSRRHRSYDEPSYYYSHRGDNKTQRTSRSSSVTTDAQTTASKPRRRKRAKRATSRPHWNKSYEPKKPEKRVKDFEERSLNTKDYTYAKGRESDGASTAYLIRRFGYR